MWTALAGAEKLQVGPGEKLKRAGYTHGETLHSIGGAFCGEMHGQGKLGAPKPGGGCHAKCEDGWAEDKAAMPVRHEQRSIAAAAPPSLTA